MNKFMQFTDYEIVRRFFCNSFVYIGNFLSVDPLSKFNEVQLYDGYNLVGIALQNVVEIDLTKNRLSPNCIQKGATLSVLSKGRFLLKAKKKWHIGTELTIGKNGFKQCKENKKPYATILSKNGDVCEVYFNWLGLGNDG